MAVSEKMRKGGRIQLFYVGRCLMEGLKRTFRLTFERKVSTIVIISLI